MTKKAMQIDLSQGWKLIDTCGKMPLKLEQKSHKNST